MIQCHICLCHCLIFQIKGVNFFTIRQIIVHGHFPVFEFGGYYTLFLRIRPFEIDFNIAIISGGDAASCTPLYMLCDYLLPPSDDGRQDSLSLQDLAIVLEKSMKWGVSKSGELVCGTMSQHHQHQLKNILLGQLETGFNYCKRI